MMNDKVWLITGCSTGFGRELAIQALERGYKVAVASRNTADIEDIVERFNENAIAVRLDMVDSVQIERAVDKVIDEFSRIDVVVNNAGIGYFGSAEESEESEVRRMFEINFFGLTALTKLVLPQMRKQRSGHIINISSVGGIVGFPAISFYNATKFAVCGFSESLAKETAHLGIKVTIVCPSGFRTDWAGRSAKETTSGIEDYKATAGANQDTIRGNSGKQKGDPVRAAKAIIDATEGQSAPLYLLLGEAAFKGAQKKLEDFQKDFTAYEQVTKGADFPAGE